MLDAWLFQIIALISVLTVCAFFLGEYMAKVFAGEKTFLSPLFGPLENLLYKIFGVDPHDEMDWKSFVASVLGLVILGIGSLFLLLRWQDVLPLNHEGFKAVRWDIAINTAISYVTGCNLQVYGIESGTSYLTRILGLGLHNFLATATSMAVAVALINAFVRKNTVSLGNFWVYLTRSILYILLPLSLVLSIFFVSQGSIANFKPYLHIKTLEGREQVIAQGPAAPQLAIKQLGSNGGGFFATNSAHPYETPNQITDFVNILAMLLIAAAFPFVFGAMLRDRSQGFVIFIAMALLFIVGVAVAMWSESQGNPLLTKLGIEAGSNMEGKEMRLGVAASSIFASVATATSTGAASSSYSSLMPLTNMVMMFNIIVGEVIFGGAGSGFIGMMFYVILTMFLIGLMIGKSPEVYGKKLEVHDMVVTMLALCMPGILQLVLSSISIFTAAGGGFAGSLGSRGLFEVIYTYVSSTANNGSAIASLDIGNKFYNLTTAMAMLIGRVVSTVAVLALAGSVAQKNVSPINTRFPTSSLLFIAVLVVNVLITGALTFFPVLVLGPILDHLYIMTG